MLTLNLAKIRAAEESFEKTYAPAAVTAEDDTFSVVAPAQLEFDIFKDKDHFRLEGRLTSTLELPCGRCLEPYVLPVDATFDLRYQPRSTNTGEGEQPVEEDDLTTAFYDNEEIDLGLLMREQFYLALPMKPLCRDDCKGLCSQCGTNLNRGACACLREWQDPRLAVLRALKNDHP
jgi:uncharacterized protein